MKRLVFLPAIVLVSLLGIVMIVLLFGLAPAIQAEEKGVPDLLRQLHSDLQELGAAVTGLSQVGLKKPSDSIVAISYLGDPCPFPGSTVNSQLLSDGTITPFSIPSGWAFMVTGIDYAANIVPTGQRTGVVVRTKDSGFVLAEGYTVNEGAPGLVSGTIPLSTPMRVTSTLCQGPGLNQEVDASRVRIRGFLVENE